MQHLYKLLLFCLLMPNLGLAQQNLVPNWSFEDTISCPSALGQINYTNGWFSAAGSPDLFHPCANSTTSTSIAGVPSNISGSQLPYNGDAYAGIATFWDVIPLIREYLGVQLQQPLIIGTEYFISAYISRGDTTFGTTGLDCATNKFGFRFSTVKYDAYNGLPLSTDNFAHFYSEDIITNSTSWTKIQGSFIADSAYSYLNIGNFFDDTNTDTISCNGIAFYYVDAICVSTSSTTCDVTVAAPTFTRKAINLYPNPATSIIEISNIDGKNSHYSLHNNTGYAVKEGIISQGNNTIDISAMPNGLYFLRLNKKKTFKVIISH